MEQSSGKSIRWQLISLVILCLVLTVVLGVLWERRSEQADSTETLGATPPGAECPSRENWPQRCARARIRTRRALTPHGCGRPDRTRRPTRHRANRCRAGWPIPPDCRWRRPVARRGPCNWSTPIRLPAPRCGAPACRESE